MKSIADFPASNTRKSGLASWCRMCGALHSNTPEVSAARKAKRNHLHENNRQFRAESMLRTLRHRSDKKSIDCGLTVEWIRERLDVGVCELTGLPFDFTMGKGPYSPSVDRIENNGGYTPENSRVVLWAINAAMGTWGLRELLKIIGMIPQETK